jgi:hypothetical protein
MKFLAEQAGEFSAFYLLVVQNHGSKHFSAASE